MERNPNPGEGDAGEAQAENETQLIEAQRSSKATALRKPEAKQIGDFRLGRLLGRGGMGAVYEAYQQSMRRTVALKILDSGIDPSSNELSRFEREAWIAGGRVHRKDVPSDHRVISPTSPQFSLAGMWERK